MSSRIPQHGIIKDLDLSAPRNRKPLITFVLIAELMFFIGPFIAGRLGFQMALTMLLWTVTILAAIIMWKAKLFRNAGCATWVIVAAMLTLGYLL